ncbi:MAG TPA: SDR family NAD(P)-dependent oxidoreductase, partial [Cytophagales bacterium]|nr:SDR family NAD(P)-dependent oxidoreductase [Cytophagales bacterium]
MAVINKTALITGATSGIGYELAKLFAKDKYNLVLVARTEARLQELAQEFSRDYGVQQVTIIPKDLSKDGAAAEVYKETQDKGIRVDVLVNDAGVG